MSYESLTEFLARLEDHGELVRIAAEVDSALELAAITDRVVKTSSLLGPALLFERVKNSTIPVVTNLFGSLRRLSLAFGVSNPDELVFELEGRFRSYQPGGWLETLKLFPDGERIGKWAPKLVKTGACQQVVRLGRDVNLWDLPVPRSWPGESHPVITSGQLVRSGSNSTKTFHSYASLVVIGQTELGWYDESGFDDSYWHEAITAKTNIPVAISLGGDPVLTLAATMPWLNDPRILAGMVHGSGLEVVRCRTNEHEVPANAEIVIEGYIDAANPVSTQSLSVARENGCYVQSELPVIQVTAITHRANPVFPATIVATPPSEESWLGYAGERLMLLFLKKLLPEVIDIHRPFSGDRRNMLFVRIQKKSPFQARRILHALWGMPSLGDTKQIVVVDAEIDVKNEADVWFAVGNYACPKRDFMFADGPVRGDDYTTSTALMASKIGIDATRKLEQETGQPWPDTLSVPDEILKRVVERWSEYGLDR
jgi:4-hydroxy-3-polyprenylbenzoate decarboxylase